MGSFPGKEMASRNTPANDTGSPGMTLNKERAEVNCDMFYSA